MKIFAYGSNMHLNRLRNRVPSATKIANAAIKGYKLKCNKISNTGSSKANIVETNNQDDIVWGIVFEIADNEKPELDRLEGLGSGYNETNLTFIDAKDNQHEAQVYIADSEAINEELLPFDWYREYIVQGAAQNQLPQDYVDQLESLEFTIDPNEERRKRNLDILDGLTT